jgi:hypothetical protein
MKSEVHRKYNLKPQDFRGITTGNTIFSGMVTKPITKFPFRSSLGKEEFLRSIYRNSRLKPYDARNKITSVSSSSGQIYSALGSDCFCCHEPKVIVVAGKHKGKEGTFMRYTAKRAKIVLDGETLHLAQSNVAIDQTTMQTIWVIACVEGLPIDVTGGKYKGKRRSELKKFRQGGVFALTESQHGLKPKILQHNRQGVKQLGH